MLPEPDYRSNTVYGPSRMVLGGGKKVTLTYLFKTPIDGQVMNDIDVGTVHKSINGRNLYAFGIVKFEDIFGYINVLGFCWRYNPSLKTFYPEDNEAYNYHHVYKNPKPGSGDRQVAS